MRIGPLEFLQGAIHGEGSVVVEHGKRMMSRCRHSEPHGGDDRGRDNGKFHECGSLMRRLLDVIWPYSTVPASCALAKTNGAIYANHRGFLRREVSFAFAWYFAHRGRRGDGIGYGTGCLEGASVQGSRLFGRISERTDLFGGELP